ncbi:GGDEF domain-containing protein [Asanoa iriomotensis]|uniref:PAS domain S-box-containing protein/diguanylate cyclase (GGDEF)-like protein n=1 Tax=Asanoa iriomotensis TaxID=234613 RepID=A0ABQ4C228_9ACTN|nr:GGDEF domain-containing protein [Asanoa iriomotensis]GIF56841.1 hypothetical protein Air01nite_29360 [Asanoa iriomotensis]
MSNLVGRGVYLAIITVIGPLMYVFGLTRTSAVVLTGGASVLAILVAVCRGTVRRRGAWLLIALSATLLTVGDAFFATATTGVIHSAEFPNVADLVFLGAYLPLAVGVLWLAPRARTPHFLLDVGVLTLGGSLVTWILVLQPAINAMERHTFDTTVAVATLVGYVAVLAAAAGTLLTAGRSPALLLIGLGAAVFLVADLLYIRARVLGTWGDSAPGGFLLLTFVVACGVAVLLPAVDTGRDRRAVRGFGPVGLIVVAVGLIVAPTVLLVEASRGVVRTGVVIGIVALVIAALVVTRVTLYVGASRRRARVTSVAREALRALAVATDEDQVRNAIVGALRRIAPDSGVTFVRDVPPPGRPGELVYPLDNGTAIVTAPAALLDEFHQTLRAMLDQAALALDRIDLVRRLQERERERYFRSIVDTSTDVILISKQDHIEYVSPSATRMFGRDVRGERFDRLVNPAREGVDWSEDGAEGVVERPGERTAVVQVYRRDLTADPNVNGVVTTLHDVTRERALQRDLERRVNQDPLTGLANPKRFHEHLGEGTHSAALVIDLDDFKAVNDTFGHQIGDGLLASAAGRIEACVRPDDVVARLGGDEFGVLLRGLDEAAAQAITQRISDALAEPAMVEGVRVDMQASIGLAFSTDGDQVVREADSALYRAKAAGKGRWRQYRPGMPAPTRQHHGARERLTRALRSGTLDLHYQPIVETATADPVGFEALLRLHDGGPPMSAPEIVETAESTGLVADIGDWVLARALADLPRLSAGSGSQRYVAVNVAPRQLRLPDFTDRVAGQLARAGVPPDRLVLEITEGDLVGEDERAWAYLAELRALGVRVAIDDYGTGYASLSYLRQEAIDVIKVDGSFLADPGSARARVLVAAVADVAGRLGLDMVAEGVHDVPCRHLLLDVGCRYAQGYLFARPMPADEAGDWTYPR